VESDDLPLDEGARIELRLRAADLVITAMETLDPAERDRLLAEAHDLIAKSDRNSPHKDDVTKSSNSDPI
jgi:hypothetical protein